MTDRPNPEPLARVLCAADGEAPDNVVHGLSQDRPAWTFNREQAERILADPGPLLEALAEAGVLHRQSRRLQRGGPREVRYATVEPDGRRDGGDGLATEWRPDARA